MYIRDRLRIAGVRHADLKGFTYSREDVEARSLANNYAQMLGQTFTHEMKPMEVEILVAEITDTQGEEQLFHILYDGTVVDQSQFVVLGGDSDAITSRVSDAFAEGMSASDALELCRSALAGADRSLEDGDLEVAMLDRNLGRRTFLRVADGELGNL